MPRRRTVVTAHTESFSKKSTLKAGEDRNSIAKRGINAREACMEDTKTRIILRVQAL